MADEMSTDLLTPIEPQGLPDVTWLNIDQYIAMMTDAGRKAEGEKVRDMYPDAMVEIDFVNGTYQFQQG